MYAEIIVDAILAALVAVCIVILLWRSFIGLSAPCGKNAAVKYRVIVAWSESRGVDDTVRAEKLRGGRDGVIVADFGMTAYEAESLVRFCPETPVINGATLGEYIRNRII